MNENYTSTGMFSSGAKIAATDDLTAVINQEVTNVGTRVIAWFITIAVSLVFGGIITAMWDLNSKIHTVVGQESVRDELSALASERIRLLEKENDLLTGELKGLIAEKAEKAEKAEIERKVEPRNQLVKGGNNEH
jgi:hypothetical protein